MCTIRMSVLLSIVSSESNLQTVRSSTVLSHGRSKQHISCQMQAENGFAQPRQGVECHFGECENKSVRRSRPRPQQQHLKEKKPPAASLPLALRSGAGVLKAPPLQPRWASTETKPPPPPQPPMITGAPHGLPQEREREE